MATVNTVLGPVDSDDLGFTLMHEHILVASWAMRQAFTDWVDVDALIDDASTKLAAAVEHGVKSMVDLTPINLGRDVHIMREVAARSGIQIICATGLYWHEEPWQEFWSADHLVERLLPDLTDGIQGTDSKAGIIKCATDRPGVTPGNEKLLQVAARLHRATGTPISTHTYPENRSGLAQQDVFEKEGVDLSRVVIGHCGDSQDLELLGEILARGSFIGMDRFGIDTEANTEQRIEVIAELCRNGFADQLVLSHDACCKIDWFPPGIDLAAAMPNWNYLHISNDVVPALRKAGVSEDQLRTLTVDNPRRVFERKEAY